MNSPSFCSLLMMVTATALTATNDAFAERETGGGHGVRRSETRLDFLDLAPDPDAANLKPMDIFTHPAVSDAAGAVLAKLGEIETAFPEFGKALAEVFRGMRWRAATADLGFVADHGVRGAGIEQIAVQRVAGDVDLDLRRCSELGEVVHKAALLTHELFLAKLGIQLPRPALRRIVRALYADNDRARGLETMRAELDAIHPKILAGGFELRMEFDEPQQGIQIWLAGTPVFLERPGFTSSGRRAFTVGIPATHRGSTLDLEISLMRTIHATADWGGYRIDLNGVRQLERELPRRNMLLLEKVWVR